MSAGSGRAAVAIGGGTGLPAVIHCLLDLGFETSAVVTMADDGGSSGQLRKQLGMLPPGDVRNCLVAMAEDEHSLEAQLFQYRFPEAGDGHVGHALGNLFLAALTDITGSFPEAIETASTFLHTRGEVLPSTLTDVYLCAQRSGDLGSGPACARSRAPRSCVPAGLRARARGGPRGRRHRSRSGLPVHEPHPEPSGRRPRRRGS